MNECSRCGKCCRTIGVKAIGMSPESKEYLLKHGCTIDDGYLIIPSRCQHLRLDEKISVYKIEVGENDEQVRVLETPKYKCDIHNTDEFPVLCRRYHGHGTYYIPDGCAFVTTKDENDEHNIYLKSLTAKSNKKQRRLGVEEGV
jgi:hypothetical protein